MLKRKGQVVGSIVPVSTVRLTPALTPTWMTLGVTGWTELMRNPRKPINRNAVMPINENAHADQVGAKRRSGG